MANGLFEDAQGEVKDQLEEPKKYKVVLLNDDYSTMDFVIGVLIDIFHKPIDEAVNIMIQVHKEGRGICGVYTFDIAETKVTQVRKEAKKQDFPLRAIMEEA